MNENMKGYTPAFVPPKDGVSEILTSVYRKMLDDGTIEKIARNQIAEMIQSILRDAMGWNGSARAKFKERIEPLLIDAIERSDLLNMTEKLTGVINQALQASAVGSYKGICDGIKSLCGAPRFEYRQNLKLSEIFTAYKKSCERAFSDVYFDKDNLEEDENGNYSVTVCCRIEVTQEKRYFGDGDYTITFTPECEDLGESEEYEIINNSFSINIHDYQEGYGNSGQKRLMWFVALDTLTLRRLPEFALYLQAAKDAACNIGIDIDSGKDDVVIELGT